MPIAHFTKLYGVVDAKAYAVTADPAGGTATYGAAIDIPGVKSLALSGTINTKQLRGDNQLLDADSTLSDITGTLTWAKSSFDILDALVGGTVTDSGSGTTEVATYSLLGTDDLPHFKLEALAAATDFVGGDVHVVLYKNIASGFPFAGLAEEDYQIQSFAFSSMPRLADSKWLDVVAHETATTLSA